MAPPMSDVQFAAATRRGGASRFLSTLTEVKPIRGYAVSTAGTERTFPSVTPGDVAAHRQAISGHPLAASPGALQGGWHEGGRDYLDLSHVYTDRRTAANAMHSNAQIGMYDFGNSSTLYSHAPIGGPDALAYSGSHAMGFQMHPGVNPDVDWSTGSTRSEVAA